MKILLLILLALWLYHLGGYFLAWGVLVFAVLLADHFYSGPSQRVYVPPAPTRNPHENERH